MSAHADFLRALRWGPDEAIWNHEAEHVWLKRGRGPCIEDCCLVAAPCGRHAAMSPPLAASTEGER